MALEHKVHDLRRKCNNNNGLEPLPGLCRIHNTIQYILHTFKKKEKLVLIHSTIRVSHFIFPYIDTKNINPKWLFPIVRITGVLLYFYRKH